MLLGYARVSTLEQEEARQLRALQTLYILIRKAERTPIESSLGLCSSSLAREIL